MAQNVNVQITSDGIRNSLKRYNSVKSICEYVWNGFDANANHIRINTKTNQFGQISEVQICDNGKGVEFDHLPEKFKPFYQSEKVYNPNEKHLNIHGKKGVGRLTFFTFASTAKWRTVYRKQNENYIYNITIESDKLDLFTHDEEVLTSEPTGTIVSFYNITDPELTVNKLEAELIKDFCWYLELNKDNHYSIYVDDTILDYSPLVVERDSKDFSVKDINLSFSVDYVCWAQKLSEYSKYYYLDSNNITKEKEYTTFNNKGDSFYHSIYIRSSLFDKFNFTSDFVEEQLDIEGNTIKHKKGIEYRTMMNEVNRFLFDKRRPFLKKHVSKVIESIYNN